MLGIEVGRKGRVEKAQQQASDPSSETGKRSGQVRAWCGGMSWCRMQRKWKPVPHSTKRGHLPLTCPFLVVAGDCILCAPRCLQRAHPVSGWAGADSKQNHLCFGPAYPSPQH